MASSNLALVQAAANRFSDKVSFGGPIKPDGGMGAATLLAIPTVIEWIADGGGLFDSISSAMRGGAAGILDIIGKPGAANATAIMQQLANIQQILTTTANELGLPAVIAPAASSSGGGGGSVIINNPVTGNAQVLPNASAASSGLLAQIGKPLGLTTVQTVLFLTMIGGVGFLAVKRMRGGR